MSLFSSIQMAGNALQANDIGLQVVGQNISNANTPGYICEEANFAASPPERYGNLVLGTGVQVQSVTEKIDAFLEQRLRSATSDQSSADSLKTTYSQLETIVGALNNSNLGTVDEQFLFQHRRRPQPARGHLGAETSRSCRAKTWRQPSTRWPARSSRFAPTPIPTSRTWRPTSTV